MEFFADLSGVVPNTASTTTVGKSIAPNATAEFNFDLSQLDSLSIYWSGAGVTGGTLDVYTEISPDGGTTWLPFWHSPQLAAAAATTTRIYSPSLTNTPTAIGSHATPVLTADTGVGGPWGARMRVMFVTGAGVSVGNTQTLFVFGNYRVNGRK